MRGRAQQAEDLEAWLRRTPARQLQDAELVLLGETLPDLFGYYTLQLGFWGPAAELLAESRTLCRFSVQETGEADLRARLDALPFQSESVDTVVLPHSLEFTEAPHTALREVDRILVPEGHVVILAFNPYSLWGLARAAGRGRSLPPRPGRFLSERRLRDWLRLLGYDILRVRRYFYRPPLRRSGSMARMRFMERLGGRFWPRLGAGYMLLARKRVCTLTPIPSMRSRHRTVPTPGLAGGASGRISH